MSGLDWEGLRARQRRKATKPLRPLGAVTEKRARYAQRRQEQLRRERLAREGKT